MKLTKHVSMSNDGPSVKGTSRIGKITGMLSQAIDEVHRDITRSKHSSSVSPSKRRSDQSSDDETIGEVL